MGGWESLINVGAIGVVLGWFLIKAEPRMQGIERAINRLVRAQMLTLLSLPYVEEQQKREAKSILDEVDEKGTEKTNGVTR